MLKKYRKKLENSSNLIIFLKFRVYSFGKMGFQKLERYYFFNPKLAHFYTRSVQFTLSFLLFNKFHFFCMSVHPSVGLSVRPSVCVSLHLSDVHHISGTVHDLIIIYGEHV